MRLWFNLAGLLDDESLWSEVAGSLRLGQELRPDRPVGVTACLALEPALLTLLVRWFCRVINASGGTLQPGLSDSGLP